MILAPWLPFDQVVISLITVSLFQVILWIIAEIRKEADVVDMGWAFSVGALGVFCALTSSGDLWRNTTLGLITLLWGTRLSGYLLVSRVLHPGEDGRYAALRSSWGAKARSNFFIFFQLQAFLAVFLATPFFVISHNPAPLSWWEGLLALTLGATSVIGESIADRQLATFRRNPANRGQVCRVGLWRYSRHPNYFFEWLHWLAYIVLAFGAPYWFLSPISAAVVLYLILYVTGIPPTEARSIASRGDAYREYQRTTSAFVPWFPRSSTTTLR
jgi:steroid 5-alpha reductase family enzyme